MFKEAHYFTNGQVCVQLIDYVYKIVSVLQIEIVDYSVRSAVVPVNDQVERIGHSQGDHVARAVYFWWLMLCTDEYQQG